MNKVKYSFIVPVYNAELYIERCISSILNLGNYPFEVIIVDDGSLDNSLFVCNKLYGNNSKIQIIHQENKGLSGARNTGIDSANGEFVFFIDSDDTVDSDLLENVEKIPNLSLYDLIVTNVRFVNDINNGYYTRKNFVFENLTSKEAIYLYTKDKLPRYAVGKFMKTRIIKENKLYFPIGHNYEDLYTIYKYFVFAKNIILINDSYYSYWISNSQSITNSDTLKNLGDFYESINEMYNGLLTYSGDFLNSLKNLRIDLLTQLYIRLFYLNQNNKDAYLLLNKVNSELKNSNIKISTIFNYTHGIKYILYRLHLLNSFLKINYTLKRKG